MVFFLFHVFSGTVEYMTQPVWCIVILQRSGFVMAEETPLEGNAMTVLHCSLVDTKIFHTDIIEFLFVGKEK